MIFCDIETQGLEATHDTNCKVRMVGMLNSCERQAHISSLRNFPDFLEKWKDEEWCFHNAKFDLQVLLRQLPGFYSYFEKLAIHDTQLMAYCLNSSEKGYSLDKLSEKYLGQKKVVINDFKEVSNEKLVERNVKDLQLTAALFEHLNLQLLQDEKAYGEYLNIEIPYMKLICLMEQAGVTVDVEGFKTFDVELHQKLEELDAKRSSFFYSFRSGTTKYTKNEEAHFLKFQNLWNKTYYSNVKGEKRYAETVLDVWNPNSAEQNARVLSTLYPDYDFKFRVTKAGKPTVKTEELINYDVPLSKVIKEHLEISKQVTSFTKPILSKVVDGTVYGNFNQTVTRTGRLSSSEPNLQNIPRKGEGGATFRSLFTAKPGNKLVVGDLDRIEIVVLAHYLNEYGFSTYMAEAIKEGVDVHTVNTCKWFDITEDHEDFGSYRDRAKTIIFAIIYGAGAAKIDSKLQIGVAACKAMMKKVEDELNLVAYKEFVTQSAKHNGGVIHTCLGRRLVIPEVLSNDNEEFSSGVRKVNNYFIQGTAGDIFKELQLRAFYELNVAPNIVVHDESLYEFPESEAQEMADKLTNIYTSYDLLSVPIRCKFNVGASWKEAK